MEKDQEENLPSTSGVRGGVVVNREVFAVTVSAATTIQGDGAAAASKKAKAFASEKQIQDVFSNNVISKHIVACLSFADMKVARQVSRSFFEMIEDSKRFKDAEVLAVTKEKPPVGELNFLQNSDRIWLGIRIDVSLFTENNVLVNDHIRHILQNVEFVSLFIPEDSLDLDVLDVKTLESIVTFIRDVLSLTTKMTHLQIGVILFNLNLKDVFQCISVKDNLMKTLKRLDITDIKNCTGITHDLYERRYPLLPGVSDDVRHCVTSNFLFLRPILPQLESFGMIFTYKDDDDAPSIFKSTVIPILEDSQNTLQELSLHLEAWEKDDITGISELTFPRLRSLTAATHTTGQDGLESFLANHQTLEELDVAVEDGFVKSLIDLIKLRSPNLRKLHIKAKKFVNSLGGKERIADWSFLRKMTLLKDFKLVRPFRAKARWELYGNGPYILKMLPQNQLESLSLKGIGQRECGFWRFKHSFVLCNFYLDLELTTKLDFLRGFRNLKRLSLRRCPDAVDDDIMQFIIKEMTCLEELEVSYCSQLTDAGISGTSKDGSDSIRNLKGLKKLSISYCPLVTPGGLLSCLRLQFLRHFEYVAFVEVTQSFVLKIVSQNPSLESLAVNLGSPFPASEFLKKVNLINSRVTKLKNVFATDEDSDGDGDWISDEEVVPSESDDDSDDAPDSDGSDND